MDTRKIRKLIELVKETGIGELEITSDNESVRISCQTSIAPAAPTQQLIAAAPAPTAPAVQHTSSHAEPETEAEKKHAGAENGYTQKSPMVGTVYLSSNPGDPPFVSVGQHVDIGETLCLIEAMKMFNKIEADKAGVISARLIDNEQPVEYDQPLFIIEADE